MKKLFVTLCALLSISTLAAQQLPDVKIEDINGREVSIRSLATKPLIIAYWSIACKPCIQELNAINDALEDWRKEADFTVVAVSVDDARLKATAKNMAKARGWEFVCLFDENQELKRAMNVSLTPQSFVVDNEGNIYYSHSGYTPGSEESLFDKVLDIKKGKHKEKNAKK